MYLTNNYYKSNRKPKFNPSQLTHNINRVDYRNGLITKQQLLESETSLKNGLNPIVYYNPTVTILSNKWGYKTI